jgi:hypothetical protein
MELPPCLADVVNHCKRPSAPEVSIVLPTPKVAPNSTRSAFW